MAQGLHPGQEGRETAVGVVTPGSLDPVLEVRLAARKARANRLSKHRAIKIS